MARMLKPDAELHRQVIEELKWDSRVNETEVGVEVDQGIVTLTGTVPSHAKRLAAQEAAHRVHGVLDVANDIDVELPGTLERNDTVIARVVRDALDWDARVPAHRIHTDVTDGWVTLSGVVRNLEERLEAERAIQYLSVVKGVSNRIEVKADPVRPTELKNRIEQALSRRAVREAERLTVEIAADGAVTLAGRVETPAEAQAVLGAVRFAPGVARVDNHLIVGPPVERESCCAREAGALQIHGHMP